MNEAQIQSRDLNLKFSRPKKNERQERVSNLGTGTLGLYLNPSPSPYPNPDLHVLGDPAPTAGPVPGGWERRV